MQELDRLSGFFQCHAVERVLYGPGCVERWRELPGLMGTRAILATTPSVARSPLFGRITSIFAPVVVATFKGSRQHAPVSVVEELAGQIAESGANMVLSVGGGSVIDSAKAAIDLRAKQTGTFLPHVAIPTTLSAAEFAASYGMTDDETRRKRRGSDPRLLPAAVILDAEMTVHTPDWLWLSSGLRAVDHAVETAIAPDCNPAAEALALEAIRLLFQFLPGSTSGEERLTGRQTCQIGAWLSWWMNASITAGTSHRLGRLIGPIYGLPHGFTSAILLPHVLDAVERDTKRQQALIAAAILEAAPTSAVAGDMSAAGLIRNLVLRLGLPSRLRDVSVPREDLPGLAGDSADDLRILEAAW